MFNEILISRRRNKSSLEEWPQAHLLPNFDRNADFDIFAHPCRCLSSSFLSTYAHVRQASDRMKFARTSHTVTRRCSCAMPATNELSDKIQVRFAQCKPTHSVIRTQAPVKCVLYLFLSSMNKNSVLRPIDRAMLLFVNKIVVCSVVLSFDSASITTERRRKCR